MNKLFFLMVSISLSVQGMNYNHLTDFGDNYSYGYPWGEGDFTFSGRSNDSGRRAPRHAMVSEGGTMDTGKDVEMRAYLCDWQLMNSINAFSKIPVLKEDKHVEQLQRVENERKQLSSFNQFLNYK